MAQFFFRKVEQIGLPALNGEFASLIYRILVEQMIEDIPKGILIRYLDNVLAGHRRRPLGCQSASKCSISATSDSYVNVPYIYIIVWPRWAINRPIRVEALAGLGLVQREGA